MQLFRKPKKANLDLVCEILFWKCTFWSGLSNRVVNGGWVKGQLEAEPWRREGGSVRQQASTKTGGFGAGGPLPAASSTAS